MQVIKNGTLYLTSSLVNKAVPFLLLPVITRYLTPAEYGTLSMFLVINSFVGAFVGMSVQANITTNFYTESRASLATIIGNVLIVLVATASIAMVVIGVVSLARETVFSIPAHYLLLTPLLAFMAMVATLNTTILRNEGRAYAFASFEIAQMLVTIGVTLMLLVLAGFGWLSQVAGLLVAGAVFLVIGVRYMRRRGYLAFRYDAARSRSILALSLPLVPHALGGTVIAISDRIFIERMIGIEAVGLYAVGYSFGMVLGLFTDACMKAWTPWVYRTLAAPTEDGKRRIVWSCYALIVGFLGMAAAVAVAARWVLPYMVSEAYQGAGRYIGWIAFGYAIRGIYQVFFPFLVHIRKTSFLAVSTVTAALLNLLLNYVLIRQYGAIGGAYATAAAFAVSAAMVFWYQNRNFPMPWFRGAA